MEQQKLIILQGIPSSGKSTFAKQFVLESPLTRVRVNRDDIRYMLGKYWVPKREGLVSTIEYKTVQIALEEGYTVVLDATNLNEAYLKQWTLMVYNQFDNIRIEYKQFPIELEEAIRRDALRENPVGEKVITNFYNKYNEKF
jgi:predicted kinase